VHPGATEVWYDGTDQDCDGNDDDKDEDGWAVGVDCDDTDARVNPGETEIWYDGTDQDCDGNDDDQDEDGSPYGTDCDDRNANAYPGAPELRNGDDDDCDGYCDEGVLTQGELIITEIMKDPSAVADNYGEWFEVYNNSAIDIGMCQWTIKDSGTDTFTMDSDVVIPPGDYAVFARNRSTTLNGGVVADYVYGSDMSLGNSGDEIILLNDGTEIDRVEYTTSFPNVSGRSLTLNPTKFDYVSNNTYSNWCRASSHITSSSSSDYGTPGAANDSCP
jgi:hypothetical protein